MIEAEGVERRAQRKGQVMGVMDVTRSLVCGWLLTLGGLGVAAEPPQPTPHPSVEAFFQRAPARKPRLSPSGRYLAIQSLARNNRMVLAVIDLETRATPKVVAGFFDADIWEHQWVNDERLVFDLSDSPDGTTQVQGSGLWAVDRDGGQQRALIQGRFEPVKESTLITDRRLEAVWHLHRVLPGDGDEVLVMRGRWGDESEARGHQLGRLNTRTGRLTQLSAGAPDYVNHWVTDYRGEPRLLETQHAGRVTGYVRDEAGRWVAAYTDSAFARTHAVPAWFGPDEMAFARASYRGYASLFRMNGQTLKADDEPLISASGYDIHAELVFDEGSQKLAGLHFETDGPSSVWFDPAMKAWQADIDAKLPGTANRIECRRCVNAAYLIVTARSDQRPPIYLLYRTATRQLEPLAGLRPDLPVAAMGQRDYHRVRTRDGLEMPVLVTQPAGGPARVQATVVLVHGGPFVRGTHWEWEAQAQFLANRGYLVLEPEFRGSEGYGYAHFRAGWKQWGLRMQDDLADALAWAVRRGLADPNRVCIAGASYGGYAALMGAVTQSKLFRCAVNWVGVTDIGLLHSIHWSDLSDEWRGFGLKALVGDPIADAAQLAATSPLKRAAEIRIPLLMAYGGMDRRVPIQHGLAMRDALQADQPVEWIEYPDEGHGWFKLKTNEDFWGRVERFLARHLASPPPAGPGQP